MYKMLFYFVWLIVNNINNIYINITIYIFFYILIIKVITQTLNEKSN